MYCTENLSAKIFPTMEKLGEEDLEIVEALLDKGAALTDKGILKLISKLKKNPELIYKSARYGHSQIIAVLLDNGFKLDPDMLLQLIFSRENLVEKDLKIVKAVLANCGKLTNKDISKLILKLKKNPELIYKSARYGYSQIIVVLLGNGLNPNMQDEDGNTLLHYAVEKGSLKIAKELLKKEIIKLDLQNKDGNTPLHLAILSQSGERLKIIKALLGKLKESIVKELRIKEPLLLATAINKETTEAVKKFLNIRDKSGNTALHFAVVIGKLEVVKLLLANGAGLNIQDQYGNTALQYAIKFNNKEIEELLKANTKITDFTATVVAQQKPTSCILL